MGCPYSPPPNPKVWCFWGGWTQRKGVLPPICHSLSLQGVWGGGFWGSPTSLSYNVLLWGTPLLPEPIRKWERGAPNPPLPQ